MSIHGSISGVDFQAATKEMGEFVMEKLSFFFFSGERKV